MCEAVFVCVCLCVCVRACVHVCGPPNLVGAIWGKQLVIGRVASYSGALPRRSVTYLRTHTHTHTHTHKKVLSTHTKILAPIHYVPHHFSDTDSHSFTH